MKISCSLDPNEINRAINEIKKFKEDFLNKVDTYRKRLGEELAERADIGFRSAYVNDVIHGGASHKPDVRVSVSDKGSITVVVADGEDAVWCEFGAGVYHNGSVGSSPNPYGKDLGFTIGSYDKGNGSRQVWGYYTAPDSKTGLVLTRGTPASMPMYNAAQEVMRSAVEIAKEVFG